MLSIDKVVRLLAPEVSRDRKFLKTLSGFYVDMKLCSSDSEKLLSAKLLIKEMDRIKNEYLSHGQNKKRVTDNVANICNLRSSRKNGML